VTARETLQHVIEMDPQYQPAYSFLANLLFKGVSTVEDSKPAFEIIDKGESAGEVGGTGRQGRGMASPH